MNFKHWLAYSESKVLDVCLNLAFVAFTLLESQAEGSSRKLNYLKKIFEC